MKISVITVFPELYRAFIKTSLIARAIENKLIELNLVRFSDMCEPKDRIDTPTCGPGSGMVLKPKVIAKAIGHCEEQYGPGYKIFFSPQGENLNQKQLRKFADSVLQKELTVKTNENMKFSDEDIHIILVCARYEGIDERVEQYYADSIFSIGDYVLMGGDLPAQVFLEGFLRYIPRVVGKKESVEKDSFSGPFFDYPQYGLPVEWNGIKIPQIVQSGNHESIEQWRIATACKKTLRYRFDWVRQSFLSQDEKKTCKSNIPNHYVALMHSDVVVRGNNGGHTSVTSLDLHDIARSSATYGVENVFMVTELEDQRSIMQEFLNFWLSKKGIEYNSSRFEAVKKVIPIKSFEKVKLFIKEKDGAEPIIITTSAKQYGYAKAIDYFSQGKVWECNRPILFVFGTGQGLNEKILKQSDYLL